MSFFLKALLSVLIGTALGLWTSQAAVQHGFLFGAVKAGPWVAFPTVGSPAIDPYARAVLARSSYLPISSDEGLAFTATTDGDGHPLSGRCDYVLESAEIPARFWSVGLFDETGRRTQNTAGRSALTSQDTLRLDRRIRIAVAPTIQSGNWLPSPPRDRFVLVLFLYESNGGTAAAAAVDTALPSIRRGECRT